MMLFPNSFEPGDGIAFELDNRFYATTQSGEPLMRPMWTEFPDETRFWSTPSQFMFGSSILVAPKVNEPEGVLKRMHM